MLPYICTQITKTLFIKTKKMENLTTKFGFTITRTNNTGLMEWLTAQGWRSLAKIKELQLQKLTFDKKEGSKEVRKWKSDCRIPAMKKSIILNYA